MLPDFLTDAGPSFAAWWVKNYRSEDPVSEEEKDVIARMAVAWGAALADERGRCAALVRRVEGLLLRRLVDAYSQERSAGRRELSMLETLLTEIERPLADEEVEQVPVIVEG